VAHTFFPVSESVIGLRSDLSFQAPREFATMHGFVQERREDRSLGDGRPMALRLKGLRRASSWISDFGFRIGDWCHPPVLIRSNPQSEIRNPKFNVRCIHVFITPSRHGSRLSYAAQTATVNTGSGTREDG
jgi:hypothetical protein